MRSTGGRLRGLVGNRSATQRVGIVAAIAVLATAPFGGLSRTHDSSAVPLKLGTRYDIGPFYVTIDKVETLKTLKPVVEPTGRNRLLVIEVDIKNRSYRAEDEGLVADAFGGDGTGAVPWPGKSQPTLNAYDVDDGSDSQTVNPGGSYRLALVVQQAPDWKPGHLVLTLNGYRFETEDPTGLDPNVWLLDHVVAQGPVDVEVKE